jgi:hypothetical protein
MPKGCARSTYTSAEIDYYATLSNQVFGYESPQVMLLHDNRLNADVIEQVLRLFEEKRYRFVSLDAAQADPAYRTPETSIQMPDRCGATAGRASWM